MSAAQDEWVGRAREADILETATRLGAQLKRHGREFVGPCPSCGGRDRFSINPQKRIFNCRGAGGGDAIKLVEHVLGYDFLGACAWITGEQPPRGEARVDPEAEARARARREEAEKKVAAEEKEEQRRGESIREFAYRLWRGGRPLLGTLGETYLRARGIDYDLAPYAAPFRFLPKLDYPDRFGGGRFPALLAAVQRHDGEFLGVWRTYLRIDGKGKAPVDNPKLGLGTIHGGAVWLGSRSPAPREPDAPPQPVVTINLCEGIETGFGIVGLLTGRETVAAALGTANLAAFDPGPAFQLVRHWPDGDAARFRKNKDGAEKYHPSPGIAAAQKAHERHLEAGYQSAMQPPASNGRDYLDVYVSLRERQRKQEEVPLYGS